LTIICHRCIIKKLCNEEAKIKQKSTLKSKQKIL